MRKPIGLCGSLALLASLVGVVALPNASGATARADGRVAPSVITAAGNVTCKVSGTSGKFSPSLTAAGTPGGDKFKLKIVTKKCAGSVNGGGAIIHVSGATLTVTGYWNPTNSCPGLATDTLGVLTWTFNWAASPAIAPTTITTSAGVPWVVAGGVQTFNFPVGGGTISGSSGSFAPVSPLLAHFRTTLPSPCTSGWGPYATTAITAGSFTVN